mgnify:CR=1 FL=1
MANLLRAESRSGVGSSHKAVIHLHLDGGPPQMDLIDPKPDAPAEIRGPFAPIPTKLDGLQLENIHSAMGIYSANYVRGLLSTRPGERIVGRALTIRTLPARPDLRDALNQLAEEGEHSELGVCHLHEKKRHNITSE